MYAVTLTPWFSCFLLIGVSCCTGTRRSNRLRNFVDLSYWLSDTTQIWPGHLKFNKTVNLLQGIGDLVIQTESVIVASHFSTHLDAPVHFIPGAWTLDQIPNENLYGPGVVVDVQEKANRVPNYGITKEDILEHERKHGRLPNRAIVFFNTGWGNYWNDTAKYLGSTSTDLNELAYPGLDVSAAEFMVNERDILGVGLDSISLDPASSLDFSSHLVLAKVNKWGIEATANLHLLPPKGFQVYVFPLKLHNASGASARVIAFL